MFGYNKSTVFCVLISVLILGATSTSVSGAPQGGSVAWSRKLPGSASLFRPALGPDGTIYTGNGAAVTAFSPDGQQLWSVPISGGQSPVTVGTDGTVYANPGAVGANPTIVALHPNGSQKWTFNAGASIHAGPNVGPDGNIYAVADTHFGGMGFFALDPGGNLLWSNEGQPELSADTGQPHEIIFGDHGAYVSMTPQGGSNGDPPVLWAFDFDGDQMFALSGSCQGQPVINPLTGNLVTGNGLCQKVETYDGTSGDLIWSAVPPSNSPCSGLANIAVGPDGSIYSAFCYRAFWSLTSQGAQRWFDDNFNFYFQMNRLSVAPDNSLLLDLGGNPGSPGWVRAFSTDDGSFLWQVDLDLTNQKANSRATFDMALGRAYFNVNRFGSNESDLFAVDLVPNDSLTPDSFKLADGLLVAGGLAELSVGDDRYFEVDPSPTKNLRKQRIDLIVQSTSPSMSPTTLNFRVESAMLGGPSGDVIQTVELLNYQTNNRELVDARPVQNIDGSVEVVPGGALSRFVNQFNGEITAVVTWKSESFAGSQFTWSIDVDETVWLISE